MNKSLQEFQKIKTPLMVNVNIVYSITLLCFIAIIIANYFSEAPLEIVFFFIVNFNFIITSFNIIDNSEFNEIFKQMGISNKDIFYTRLNYYIKHKIIVFTAVFTGILSILSLVYFDTYFFLLSYILHITVIPAIILKSMFAKKNIYKSVKTKSIYAPLPKIKKYQIAIFPTMFALVVFNYFGWTSIMLDFTSLLDASLKYLELTLLTFIPITIFSTIKLYKTIITDEEKYDYNV